MGEQFEPGPSRRASALAGLLTLMVLTGSGYPTARADVPLKYVALGDSAAAGPLIPDAGTPWDCFKSTHNYPAVLAGALGADLTDATCSGAEIPDLVDHGQTVLVSVRPPQIDAVSADTDLITITIGGNDIGMVQLGARCAGMSLSGAGSCRDAFVHDGVDTISQRIDQLRPAYAHLIDRLRDAAPHARIVLVGYGTYLRPGGCFPTQPLVPDAADYIRAKGAELNSAAHEVATAHGIDFFDAEAATVGHDICAAPGDRDFEGFLPTPDDLPAAPLHPTAAGMATIGSALSRMLR
ncbi:SGNH/GDSL hydrolase family protein [Nocardia sp. CDC160]|uniref:SGNH/GDSL hydrolase family protein n=1 Tax=Nocardia sp. CDC160 TaxID=3112166 RepID=UPI002DBFF900|nr:SGNH/GDSL hydrolase family protein [Nocardia sp. CDC160]MEC3917313.1 SGNH/GDSL hydrolase family protein [Nocardia sp. CDC160]